MLRAISSVVCAAFLVSDLAWAAPEGILSTPAVVKLPASVAQIDEVFSALPRFPASGSAGKVIYLIQDAHTNLSGQLNLSKALSVLGREQKTRLVFLEAGSGDDSLSALRNGPAESRQKKAYSFLSKGEISGAEYLDLSSDLDIDLWGVEDKELYHKAVQSYRDVIEHREDLIAYLDQARHTVTVLKRSIFSPALLALDQKREAFLSHQSSIPDYLSLLLSEAKRMGVAPADFPHVVSLADLNTLEKSIDFQKASEEQDLAVASLPKEDLAAFSGTKRGEATALTTLSPETKGFYSFIEEKLPGLSDYPEFQKYLSYLKNVQSIDMRALLDEEKKLENILYEKMARAPDEKKLYRISENIRSLKTLLNLTLTPDEFRELSIDPSAFDMTTMTGFLNRKIMGLDRHHEKVVFLDDRYAPAADKAREFYELTLRRDEAFLDNALKKMDEEGEESAVLIAGGYHAPHLKELLKARGVSYVCITPQIIQETNLKRYEKILLSRADEVNGTVKKNGKLSINGSPKWIAPIPAAEVPSVYAALEVSFGVASGARLAVEDQEQPPASLISRMLSRIGLLHDAPLMRAYMKAQDKLKKGETLPPGSVIGYHGTTLRAFQDMVLGEGMISEGRNAPAEFDDEKGGQAFSRSALQRSLSNTTAFIFEEIDDEPIVIEADLTEGVSTGRVKTLYDYLRDTEGFELKNMTEKSKLTNLERLFTARLNKDLQNEPIFEKIEANLGIGSPQLQTINEKAKSASGARLAKEHLDMRTAARVLRDIQNELRELDLSIDRISPIKSAIFEYLQGTKSLAEVVGSFEDLHPEGTAVSQGPATAFSFKTARLSRFNGSQRQIFEEYIQRSRTHAGKTLSSEAKRFIDAGDTIPFDRKTETARVRAILEVAYEEFNDAQGGLPSGARLAEKDPVKLLEEYRERIDRFVPMEMRLPGIVTVGILGAVITGIGAGFLMHGLLWGIAGGILGGAFMGWFYATLPWTLQGRALLRSVKEFSTLDPVRIQATREELEPLKDSSHPNIRGLAYVSAYVSDQLLSKLPPRSSGARLAGAKRDAVIKLVTQGSEKDIPDLIASLRDEDPIIRQYSAVALGRIATQIKAGQSVDDAIIALDDAIQIEESPNVRWYFAEALGKIHTSMRESYPAGARLAGMPSEEPEIKSAVFNLTGRIPIFMTFDGETLTFRNGETSEEKRIDKSFPANGIPILIKIGREESNDVVVPPYYAKASRFHAHINIEGDGSIYLTDVSALGTFAGSDRIPQGKRVKLMTIPELGYGTKSVEAPSTAVAPVAPQEDMRELFKEAGQLVRKADVLMKGGSLEEASKAVSQASKLYATIRRKDLDYVRRSEANENLKLLEARQHQLGLSIERQEEKLFVYEWKGPKEGEPTGEETTYLTALREGKPTAAVSLFVRDWRGKLYLQRKGNLFGLAYPGALGPTVAGRVKQDENPLQALKRLAAEELGVQVDPRRLKRIESANDDRLYGQRSFHKMVEYTALEAAEWEKLKKFSEEKKAAEAAGEPNPLKRIFFIEHTGFRRMFMVTVDAGSQSRLDAYAAELENDPALPIQASDIRIQRVFKAVWSYEFSQQDLEKIEGKIEEASQDDVSDTKARRRVQGLEAVDATGLYEDFLAHPEKYAVDSFIPSLTTTHFRQRLFGQKTRSAEQTSALETRLAGTRQKIANWYDSRGVAPETREKLLKQIEIFLDQIELVRRVIGGYGALTDAELDKAYAQMQARFPEGLSPEDFRAVFLETTNLLANVTPSGERIAAILFQEMKKKLGDKMDSSLQSYYALAGMHSDEAHERRLVETGADLYRLYSLFLEVFEHLTYDAPEIQKLLQAAAADSDEMKSLLGEIHKRLQEAPPSQLTYLKDYFGEARAVSDARGLLLAIGNSPHEFTKHLRLLSDFVRDFAAPSEEAKKFLTAEEDAVIVHIIEKYLRLTEEKLEEITEDIGNADLKPFARGGMNLAYKVPYQGIEYVLIRPAFLEELLSIMEEKESLDVLGELLLNLSYFMNEINILRRVNHFADRNDMPYLLQAVEGQDFLSIESDIVKISEAVIQGDTQRAFELFGKFKEKLDEIYLFRIEQQFPLNSSTLDKVIKEKAKTGGWEIRKALKLVQNLAASYEYLARAGIVHRDIKPGNIVVTGESDRARIIDFGISVMPWEGKGKASLSDVIRALEEHKKKRILTGGYFPTEALKDFKPQMIDDPRRDLIAFWTSVLPLFGVNPFRDVPWEFELSNKKKMRIKDPKPREEILEEIVPNKQIPSSIKNFLINAEDGVKMNFSDFPEEFDQEKAAAAWRKISEVFGGLRQNYETSDEKTISFTGDFMADRMPTITLASQGDSPTDTGAFPTITGARLAAMTPDQESALNRAVDALNDFYQIGTSESELETLREFEVVHIGFPTTIMPLIEYLSDRSRGKTQVNFVQKHVNEMNKLLKSFDPAPSLQVDLKEPRPFSIKSTGARLAQTKEKTRDRSGFGFTSGKLTASESSYKERLFEFFNNQGFSTVQRDSLLNALVRIKEDSLRTRSTFFLDEAAIQSILQYKNFDAHAFIQRIKEEKEKYTQAKDPKGKPLFKDTEIYTLLFRRLIPLYWIKELIQEGLSKTQATFIVTTWSNPKEYWQDTLKPLRDELIQEGLSKSQATYVVTTWSNPKEYWEDTLKPLRDELIQEGLNKSQATLVVTGWSNPKEYWQDTLKPLRDELIQGGLNKTYATRVVTGWSSPKEYWQNTLKPLRDELIQEGLNKTYATRVVTGWSNPKEYWQDTLKPLRDELIEEGLSKSHATLVVTRWSNPKEYWQKTLKPLRDELIQEGLNKSQATYVVTRWSNPKEYWQDTLKPLRDELIEEGLNKTHATLVVTGWSNAKEKIKAINQTVPSLSGMFQMTPKQTRIYLLSNEYETVRQDLKEQHHKSDQEIDILLIPLKTYEEQFGTPSGARLSEISGKEPAIPSPASQQMEASSGLEPMLPGPAAVMVSLIDYINKQKQEVDREDIPSTRIDLVRAIVNLGQFGPSAQQAVPVLLELGRSYPGLYRQASVNALSRIAPHDQDVIRAIAIFLTKRTSDGEDELETESALIRIGREAIPHVQSYLNHNNPVVRDSAERVLYRIQNNIASPSRVELRLSEWDQAAASRARSGARLADPAVRPMPALSDVEKADLENFAVKLFFAQPDKLDKDFAMNFGELTNILRIHSERTSDNLESLILQVKTASGFEPVLTVKEPRKRFEELKKVGSVETLSAQDVLMAQTLSEMNARMSIPSPAGLPAGEAGNATVLYSVRMSLKMFQEIGDPEVFRAQISNLYAQMVKHYEHAKTKNREASFILTDKDVLTNWQSAMMEEEMKEVSSFVHLGEPKVLQGVTIDLVRTEEAKDKVSSDGKRLFTPIGEVDATGQDLLGWHKAFGLADWLAGRYLLDPDKKTINFDQVKATDSDVQNVLSYYNTHLENKDTKLTAETFISIVTGRADTGTFQKYALHLPVLRKIPFHILIQAAKLALKAVGAAA